MTTSSEKLQADHYDKIAVEFAAHYNDKWSRKYRHKFICEPLFQGMDLAGVTVLEAMCGSGGITDYLVDKGADVTALDISKKELEILEQNFPDIKTRCVSILDTEIEDESFDCVVVVGGLHHLHPNLSPAIVEIARILKPNGMFCFAEPHKGSVFDAARQLWYKSDDLFEDNEEGIDVRGLKEEFGDVFEFKTEKYCGNAAYLLTYNSMVFRIPLGLKKFYSPLMLWSESVIEKLQTRATSMMVVAQWRKK